ncbi:MAG: DNA ligase, partial [Halorubrum sp.]
MFDDLRLLLGPGGELVGVDGERLADAVREVGLGAHGTVDASGRQKGHRPIGGVRVRGTRCGDERRAACVYRRSIASSGIRPYRGVFAPRSPTRRMEFAAFAERAERLAAEPADIETTLAVADLLAAAGTRGGAADRDDLATVTRFLLGRVFPAHDTRTLDVGPALCREAIARAAGPNVSAADVED